MSLTPAMAVAKRQLRFERDGGQWTINGVTWEDVETSGFTKLFANPQPFNVEQWTIINESGRLVPPGPHPPDRRQDHRPEHQRRQAVRLGAGPEGRLLRRRERVRHRADAVRHPARRGGQYMIHCHNLVHEDHDMMVQFSVGDPTDNDPITSDPPVRDTTPAGSFPPVYRPGFPAGT